MNPVNNFYYELFNHTWLYFLLIFIIANVYNIIFKKYCTSLLDPLATYLIAQVICTVTIIFMYIVNIMSSELFLYYIISQLLFIVGFKVGSINIINKNICCISCKNFNEFNIKFIFITLVFLYIAVTSLIYYIEGIPILMDNRLDIFRDGTGSGLLGRIQSQLSIILSGLAYPYLYISKSRLIKYIILAPVILVQILNGSKGAVFGIAISAYVGMLFFKNMDNFNFYIKWKKSEFKFFSIAIIGFIVTTFMFAYIEDSSKELYSLFFPIFNRLAMSGDIFIMGFQENIIDKMNSVNVNPFYAIFGDFIGLVRILPYEKIPQALGNELHEYVNGVIENKGPNPIHNAFGYTYFGLIGGGIYCLIIGYIISSLRYKLSPINNKNFFSYCLFINLFINSISLSIDIRLGIQYFTNFLIICILIFPLMFIPLKK